MSISTISNSILGKGLVSEKRNPDAVRAAPYAPPDLDATRLINVVEVIPAQHGQVHKPVKVSEDDANNLTQDLLQEGRSAEAEDKASLDGEAKVRSEFNVLGEADVEGDEGVKSLNFNIDIAQAIDNGENSTPVSSDMSSALFRLGPININEVVLSSVEQNIETNDSGGNYSDIIGVMLGDKVVEKIGDSVDDNDIGDNGLDWLGLGLTDSIFSYITHLDMGPMNARPFVLNGVSHQPVSEDGAFANNAGHAFSGGPPNVADDVQSVTDTYSGNSEDDVLFSDLGDDILKGAADDHILGDALDNILEGRANNNRFGNRFGQNDGDTDTIAGFSDGEVIDISSILSGNSLTNKGVVLADSGPNTQPATSGHADVSITATATVVSVSSDSLNFDALSVLG